MKYGFVVNKKGVVRKLCHIPLYILYRNYVSKFLLKNKKLKVSN